MKVNRSVVLFALLVQVLFCGRLSAQRYDGLIDKSVAVVGNEIIQLSTLEAEVQMMIANGYMGSEHNLRCNVLENLMVQKLYLNQAKLDSLSAKEEMVEMMLQERLSDITTRLGGERATEEYFKKPLHKLKQEWRDILREQSLTQQMQQKVMQEVEKITPGQVEQFYKRTDKDSLPIISTGYKLSQICIYPDKKDPVMRVKEQLLSFRDRILKGEKFSTLATLYSEDPGSAVRGGELRMASKNLYWPAFSDAAMALKPGQISQIVETPDGFHLIQMIAKEGEMFNARHILLKPRFTAEDRNKAFKLLDSLRHKIMVDSLEFETAARYYSMDSKTATNGGQMVDQYSGSITFEKDQLQPQDYAELKNLKEGEISEPFETLDTEGRGNTVYKIIRLDKIIPSHTATYKDDYIIMQNIAEEQLRKDAIEKFIKDKIKVTYIRIDDLFKNCPFEREGWIK